MSTSENVSLNRALALAESIVAKRRKFGKLGAGTFTQDELQAAVVAMYVRLEELADGLTKDEATKLRRQLAAANARVAKLSGKPVEEDAA